MFKHNLTTLKNNLRLITVPMSHVESATVMISVGAGSRNETKKVNGLFHFIEHMAFKGTKKRPKPLTIASEVDGVGGQFNAFTDKETTCYYIKLAAKHIPLAFDILSDMLTNSLLEKEEINKEKGVIIEEINMYEDIPMRRIQEVFIKLLYGDNPMGWDIAGTKTSILGIGREDFLNFQNKFYFPQNMVVVVAGKFKEKEIEKLTKNYLGHFKKVGKKQVESIKRISLSQNIKLSQSEPRMKLINKKTEQAHFCLGVAGYSYSHPQRFTAGILATILGGGMSSRLWAKIRDQKALAYYIVTQPEFHTDSGYLFTQSGVRLDKIGEAIKIVKSEYEKIGKISIGKKELVKAKEHLKGNMILGLEDSQDVATRFSYQALLEKNLRTPQETMRLIDKVTSEDVRKVASEIFGRKNLNLAVIGPYENEEKFRQILK